MCFVVQVSQVHEKCLLSHIANIDMVPAWNIGCIKGKLICKNTLFPFSRVLPPSFPIFWENDLDILKYSTLIKLSSFKHILSNLYILLIQNASREIFEAGYT